MVSRTKSIEQQAREDLRKLYKRKSITANEFQKGILAAFVCIESALAELAGFAIDVDRREREAPPISKIGACMKCGVMQYVPAGESAVPCESRIECDGMAAPLPGKDRP